MKDHKTRRITFFNIAWPAAAEGILINLLTSVDLIMAGSLGANAQAAIGIISQPRMMALLFVRAFATALTAVLARRYGEGREDKMGAIFRQGIGLIGLVYLLLIGLALIFFPQVLILAGAKKAYFSEGLIYGRLIFLGLFFNALSIGVNAGHIAMGKTTILFKANVLGNIVNCLINYLLIYGPFGLPKLGILGLGLGTLIGNLVSLSISVYSLKDPDHSLSLKGGGYKPRVKDLGPALRVLKGSLPEQFFERVGMFLYTVMVASLGVVGLAVHHIAMTLCDIFYSAAMGLGTASSATTGQMLGKKSPKEAFAYGKIGERFGLILASIGFLAYYFFREPIFNLFSDDAAVVSMGSRLMLIVALVSFPQSLSLVHSGVLKGAGDTSYVAKYSFFIIAIFRPILTYILLFKLGLGLRGAWISLLCDQSLRAIAATSRFYSKKWTSIKL